MLTTLNTASPASNAIDGNTATIASTASALFSDQWISVQAPAGAAVGYVAIYNRADGQPAQGWLSPFEVFLGASAGAQTHSCGGEQTLPAGAAMGPFTVQCGGRSDLPFITVRIRSSMPACLPMSCTNRYLAIGEIKAYAMQFPPSPPPPSPPTAGPLPPPSPSPPPPSPSPPPPSPSPPPAPPIPLTRLGAQLSTQLVAGYWPASNAMDGNTGTLVASGLAQATDQWVSVQVSLANGAQIGNVAVYNRADGMPYSGWLSPYELWLGSSYGNLQYSCAGSLTAGSGAGPFTTNCAGGPSGLQYVTLLLRSGTARYLTIGEIEVFAA